MVKLQLNTTWRSTALEQHLRGLHAEFIFVTPPVPNIDVVIGDHLAVVYVNEYEMLHPPCTIRERVANIRHFPQSLAILFMASHTVDRFRQMQTVIAEDDQEQRKTKIMFVKSDREAARFLLSIADRLSRAPMNIPQLTNPTHEKTAECLAASIRGVSAASLLPCLQAFKGDLERLSQATEVELQVHGLSVSQAKSVHSFFHDPL